MVLRLQGLLLFLLLAAGFFLLLTEPVDPLMALLAGAVVLGALPFLTGPFFEANLSRRCFYWGEEIAPGCGYRVVSGGKERTFNCYNDQARDRVAKFLTFCQKWAWPLRILLFGSLIYYFVMEALLNMGMGWVPAFPNIDSHPLRGSPGHQSNLLVVRTGLGLTGLALFWGPFFVKEGLPHHAETAVRCPLPVSMLSLLGVFWTRLLGLGLGFYWLSYAIVDWRDRVFG